MRGKGVVGDARVDWRELMAFKRSGRPGGRHRVALEARRQLLRRGSQRPGENVSLYYTEGGSRKALKYVDAPVALGS